MSLQIDSLDQSIKALDNWITNNGWSGYDPYDIQCAFMLHKFSKKNRLAKKVHGYIFRMSNKKFPLFARRFLRVKPQINPKAMGLFMEGYSKLYSITREELYLEKARYAANWLLENPNENYSNLCWGYPFDWQSKIFIPKGTPSGVATTAIGRGFWELYNVTKEKKYLRACESICKFILNDLTISKNENGVCFSYTPIDDFQVHNANLFDAEFLTTIGNAVGNKNWIEKGLLAANFSIAEMNPDGSLCYWSEESRKKLGISCTSDHYHSGFEIRMLYGIWKVTKEQRIKKAAEKYYKYYHENFFASDYAPILTPKGSYTVDIHSCAEALILNSNIAEYDSKGKEILEKTGEWIIENMQMANGAFRYKLIKTAKKEIRNDIPYLRWGQAWMLLGLSNALEILGK